MVSWQPWLRSEDQIIVPSSEINYTMIKLWLAQAVKTFLPLEEAPEILCCLAWKNAKIDLRSLSPG